MEIFGEMIVSLKERRMKNFKGWLLIILLISQSACSLFFGNIKPIEEKSTAYGIQDLSVTNSDWVRLDSKSHSESSDTKDHPQSGVSDMAFQSIKTASIISINSACRATNASESRQGLKELTRELLLGISEITMREETPLTLQNTPALRTTIKGRINDEEMMLQTVVLQRAKCVYDLMYVTRPDRFEANERDFSSFVASLRLK